MSLHQKQIHRQGNFDECIYERDSCRYELQQLRNMVTLRFAEQQRVNENLMMLQHAMTLRFEEQQRVNENLTLQVKSLREIANVSLTHIMILILTQIWKSKDTSLRTFFSNLSEQTKSYIRHNSSSINRNIIAHELGYLIPHAVAVADMIPPSDIRIAHVLGDISRTFSRFGYD